MDVSIKQNISGIVTATLICFVHHVFAQQNPQLEFAGNKVWIKNLNEEVLYTFCRYNNDQKEWTKVFPIKTKDGGAITIQGNYEVFPTSVSFTPRFPFAKGVHYQATFNLEELARNFNEVYLPETSTEALHLNFKIETSSTSTPEITAIYPSAKELPENLLKFHIVFSTAMTMGEVYKRVRLLDSKGHEAEKAFLIVDQELWDPEMKTLTLLLDPGRIKRGLKGNEEMGAPLQGGENYTLKIESGWKNIHGDLTQQSFSKTFRCIKADRDLPSANLWKVTPPLSENESLLVQANESLDYILASRAFYITDQMGNIVNGNIKLLKNETVIAFQPASEWLNGTYQININPLLEDLAGNNFTRVFDKDTEAKDRAVKTPDTTLSFTFKSPVR